MDQRRQLLFTVSAMTIFLVWYVFVIPRLMPQKPPQAPPPVAKNAEEKKQPEVKAEPAAVKPPKEPVRKLVEHPHRADLKIGSLDPTSAYRLQVTLNTTGGTIEAIELNDPKYCADEKPFGPLKLVGQGKSVTRSLSLAAPAFDTQLEPLGKTLATVDWEVVPRSHTASGIAFRYRSPDDKWEVVRKYQLTPLPPTNGSLSAEAPGYDLAVDLEFRNLADKARTVQYEMFGPVGLPLEHPDSRKYRDVAAGFLEADGTVRKNVLLTAQQIVDGKSEEWQRPPKYIGVDVQYFAAVLLPQGKQLEEPYFQSMRGVLIGPNEKEKSDVSVRLTSNELKVPAAAKGKPGELTHSFILFAGPKREEFLQQVGAEKLITWGYSGSLGIPQFMLGLLKFFAGLFPTWAWPYGWAIILLTVCVRSAMFPFSRKQALAAAKMQEIQPEIAALKKKFGNDTEKLGRAQMELFRKHNYNPFGGCLLMFVQLPIFIGLYQALNISVDLRMAKFLWINNLAAPDRLFAFGFTMPFLGEYFNLLPLITMGLFFLQQKLFMPPPADKEQEMQFKMMNYMMIFMGFMFYNVAAGLCVYFIASTCWGLAERKLLPKPKPKLADPDADVTVEDTPPPPPAAPPRGKDRNGDDRPKGFFALLQEAADKAQEAKRKKSKPRR